jgi:hypothetical protein
MGQGVGRVWRPPAPRVERARSFSDEFWPFGPEKSPSTVQQRLYFDGGGARGLREGLTSRQRRGRKSRATFGAVLRACLVCRGVHTIPVSMPSLCPCHPCVHAIQYVMLPFGPACAHPACVHAMSTRAWRECTRATLWTRFHVFAEFWNTLLFFSKGRNAFERVAAGLAGGFRRARVGPFGLRGDAPRPWSMPTTARANRTDGDAEAGAAEAEKCKKDGASTRCRGARRQDQGAQRRAWLDQQRSARRRTGCVAAALPAVHDAQDSRWLQDSADYSADSVAWAAQGMPELPHGISRPG